MTFDEKKPVVNFYATKGSGRNLAFMGHCDVVCPGNLDAWDVHPFAGTIKKNQLYGRGAVDMKGSIACWLAALSKTAPFLTSGKLSILITGNEEGVNPAGIKNLLPALLSQGETFDGCITGEPTSQTIIGDTIKIGRRGNMTCHLTIEGKQGHTGYIQNSKNALHQIVKTLEALKTPLDDGNPFFEPSHLSITNINTPNNSHNIVPGIASATCNIRFNTQFTKESLIEHLNGIITNSLDMGFGYTFKHTCSAEPFLTQNSDFTTMLQDVCKKHTKTDTHLSTQGGTSDSRFMAAHAPVADLGLKSHSMHAINEHVSLYDIQALESIYVDIIKSFFKTS